MKKNKRLYDFADEIYQESNDVIHHEVSYDKHVKITKITLLKDDNYYQKKKGTYISLEVNDINELSSNDKLIFLIAKCLKDMIKKKHLKKKKVLVVGLGNINYSSDALGPKTINHINVTSHLKKSYGFHFTYDVSSFVPGVMSQTGMESALIVKSLLNEMNFSLVIVIDALATTSINRLYKVIQITDTGINPGSGVNNHRLIIDSESMGCPVIAIGVATVVEGASLIYDIIQQIDNKKDDKITYSFIKSFLSNNEQNYIFTSKDIEQMISCLANILGSSLNITLNPSLT